MSEDHLKKIVAEAKRKAQNARLAGEVTAAIVKARNDGLALFRPQPPQFNDQTAMLKETCFGQASIGGNRSGKSVGMAVKFAAIARGKPIRTFDGETIECRRPHQKNRKLELWCIGYDWEHIGHTIHKMLFEPQLFKVITDRETGQLRAWRPWEPDDLSRADEAKWAPPLIPESEIVEFAWVNKALKQFSRVDLKNGNTIYAFASTGAVKAGDAVDIIWIDEKIAFQEYVAEWQARLVDNRGNFLWSSWPYGDNQALRNMHDRWEEQRVKLVPEGLPYDTRVFHSTFEKNPYLDAKEKANQIDRWGEKEARARNLGQFVMDGMAIYPQFMRELHCAIYPVGDPLEDEISKILRRSNGVPPSDWCCELSLDPGTAKPALLLCAVPPRKFWNGDEPPLIVWDEIYPVKGGRGMNADELAKALWDRVGYDRIWNRWIIDGQAGRQTPMGFGKTIERNYAEAFEKAGLSNMQTGNHFIAGSADFPTRANEVQKMLGVRLDGRPRLRIVTSRCPNLVLQMETNVKKMSNDVADERPAPNQMDDCRSALEYWISRSPAYLQPERLREKNETEDYLNWLAEMRGPAKEGVYCGRG